MPLPQSNSTWPPANVKPALDLMAIHDAWYVGDADELSRLYRQAEQHSDAASASSRGGLVGFVKRMFWGQQQESKQRKTYLHLPLPADIATLSADLLFSEPPQLILDQADNAGGRDGVVVVDTAQQVLDDVVNIPQTHAALLEAGEVAAALGGAYLRLVWDTERTDRVEVEVVHADNAIPTFWGNHLTEVAFWTAIEEPKTGDIWRHVQVYQPGRILHGLYHGDSARLGTRVPLESHPSTEWLTRPGVLQADGETMLLPGTTEIGAAYFPNIRPNRRFRKDATLGRFGRSDYDGIEHLFDAADEVLSSWQRDIRLGKGRLIVPNSFLENMGVGNGSKFDTETEVYTPLDFLGDAAKQQIIPSQFAIRVTEHDQTLQARVREAMRTAGYSTASVGQTQGGIRTATEVNAEGQLTDRTRDKKMNYWRALGVFVKTWLDVNAAVYNTEPLQSVPVVRFPVETQQDTETVARTAAILGSARAASIHTLVRMNHNDWNEERISEEVQRIYTENGLQPSATPDGATDNGAFAATLNGLAQQAQQATQE